MSTKRNQATTCSSSWVSLFSMAAALVSPFLSSRSVMMLTLKKQVSVWKLLKKIISLYNKTNRKLLYYFFLITQSDFNNFYVNIVWWSSHIQVLGQKISQITLNLSNCVWYIRWLCMQIGPLVSKSSLKKRMCNHILAGLLTPFYGNWCDDA